MAFSAKCISNTDCSQTAKPFCVEPGTEASDCGMYIYAHKLSTWLMSLIPNENTLFIMLPLSVTKEILIIVVTCLAEDGCPDGQVCINAGTNTSECRMYLCVLQKLLYLIKSFKVHWNSLL